MLTMVRLSPVTRPSTTRSCGESSGGMLRWNAVLVILAVLVALDAILIMTRDMNYSATREHLLREAGMMGHIHMGKNKNKQQPNKEEAASDMPPGIEMPPPNDEEGESSAAGDEDVHKVAGLSCDRFGGPPEELAAEMVYWDDIPSDATYVSPLKSTGPEPQYLTFEPDEGEFVRCDMHRVGWLVVRMRALLSLSSSLWLTLHDSLYNRRLEQHSNVHGNCRHIGTCHGEDIGNAPRAGNVFVGKKTGRQEPKESIYLYGLFSL